MFVISEFYLSEALVDREQSYISRQPKRLIGELCCSNIMLSLRIDFRRNLIKVMRSYSNIQNMSKPTLYGDEISPPVRFAMITASILGVDIHFHKIDLIKQENRSEAYKKINPLQKVPAFSVDGLVITDSHAIALYLCRSVENQDLYPRDKTERAKVDQMIFYNATTLFPTESEIFNKFVRGMWPIDEDKVANWYNVLDHVEHQLKQSKWLAGNKMQLCDICCAMSISSLNVLVPQSERHIKIKEWLKKLDGFGAFEVNKRALEALSDFVEQMKINFEKPSSIQ